ncbi:MAG: hypothetical protein VB862_15150 [Pirellulaceae bacterium]
MKQLTLFLIPLLAVALLVGCGSDNDSGSSATQQNTANTEPQTDPAETAGEAVALRYRFEQGQRIDYLQKNRLVNNILTTDTVSEINIAIYCHITIDTVEADGTATATWINDRVIYKLQAPIGTLKFDSADGEEPDNPAWQQIKPMVQAIQNAQGNFRVTTAGIVSDFKLTKELAARLKTNPAMAAIATSGQLEAVAEGLFARLPDEPVKLNETWNTVSDLDLQGDLKVDQETIRTYRGEEQHDGKDLVRLDNTLRVTTKLGPEAMYKKLQFNADATAGTEWFDLKLGWLVEESDKSVLEMEMEVSGTLVVVESTTETTLKLQPPPPQ